MTERDIGRLEAQCTSLQRDVAALREDVTSIRNSVDGIQIALAQARGGWRMASGIGAVVGAAIAFVGQVLLK